MVSEATSIGLLTATSVLYGFVIVFYGFTRARLARGQWELEMRAARDRWPAGRVVEERRSLQRRTLWSNGGLVVASLLYLYAVLAPFFLLVPEAAFSPWFDAFLADWSAVGFFLFLFSVIAAFVWVAIASYREARRRMPGVEADRQKAKDEDA